MFWQKNTGIVFFVTAFARDFYVKIVMIFLYFKLICGIITFVKSEKASQVGCDLRRKTMRNFYQKVWVPFTITKKRVLILAIASYIALC